MRDAIDPQSVPAYVQRQIDVAMAAFQQHFSHKPSLAGFAPGRINLIGEHTDYNLGFVFPMATDRTVVIVAALAGHNPSRCIALDLGESVEFDLTAPLKPMDGRAANYLLGVADQFHQRGIKLPNLDLVVSSTIPIGAGLASSAAVEVAFAQLLCLATGTNIVPTELAKLCQRAEHTFPDTPCGIMDMYVATMARPDHAMLLDCRNLKATFVPMPPPTEAVLLIADTGVKHRLATSAYADRRRECESAATALAVPSLRDAEMQMLNQASLDPQHRKRALHVVAENSRTILAAEALSSGNLEALGRLMLASHDSLRDLYEVSCPELNVLVDTARTHVDRGVFGARMTGGGFGGCAIVLCRPEAVDRVAAELKAAFSSRFDRSPSVFLTQAAGCGRAIQIWNRLKSSANRTTGTTGTVPNC